MKRVTTFLTDFRDFAVRGNVINLAVGVIIGGAFGKITTSLVGDVLMPLIGLILGGLNFTEWQYTLPTLWAGQVPTTLKIGMFLQSVVDFVIIAFCVFLLIRVMAKLDRKPPEAPKPEPPPPPEDTVLLREMRSLLAENVALQTKLIDLQQKKD